MLKTFLTQKHNNNRVVCNSPQKPTRLRIRTVSHISSPDVRGECIQDTQPTARAKGAPSEGEKLGASIWRANSGLADRRACSTLCRIPSAATRRHSSSVRSRRACASTVGGCSRSGLSTLSLVPPSLARASCGLARRGCWRRPRRSWSSHTRTDRRRGCCNSPSSSHRWPRPSLNQGGRARRPWS